MATFLRLSPARNGTLAEEAPPYLKAKSLELEA